MYKTNVFFFKTFEKLRKKIIRIYSKFIHFSLIFFYKEKGPILYARLNPNYFQDKKSKNKNNLNYHIKNFPYGAVSIN